MISEWIMNWKGHGRKQSWPNFRKYPCIFLEKLRKNTKTSVRGRDLSPRSPDYEAGVITARLQRSIQTNNDLNSAYEICRLKSPNLLVWIWRLKRTVNEASPASSQQFNLTICGFSTMKTIFYHGNIIIFLKQESGTDRVLKNINECCQKYDAITDFDLKLETINRFHSMCFDLSSTSTFNRTCSSTSRMCRTINTVCMRQTEIYGDGSLYFTCSG
jgi:hypothetical protein